MRQNPLRLHADTAQTFEHNGEGQAFRNWLACHRPDLAPETQQALVRHLARAISAFGPTAINAALFDLTTFELRLRITAAVDPNVPDYATRHWRRAIRHFVAAAYGMTGREARRVLDGPRSTLAQARRAGVSPLPVRPGQVADQHGDEDHEAIPEGWEDAHAGATGSTQPTIDQLVDATRSTWATLARAGDVQPEMPDQLVTAQLACLSTKAKVRLVTEADVLDEPVGSHGRDVVLLTDLVDEALKRVLRQRLALAADGSTC